jgi:hypothetical protein
MADQTLLSPSPISIKLTESAVFLRSHGTPYNRRPLAQAEDTGILRGLLVLTFEKPVKVSEIVAKLTCTCSATWQEGVELGKIDITEEDITFKAEQVFFKASRRDRRRASLPPAIPSNRQSQNLSDGLKDQRPLYTPTALDERSRQLRPRSVDLTHFRLQPLESSETRYSPPAPPLTEVNRSELQSSLMELRDQRSSSWSFFWQPYF